MGVFSKNSQPVDKEKRYNYDMYHQNCGTYKFGGLYPVLCAEALAGDTWKLNASFGLRFMPTFFPLQTKIKAKLDFFYVRNRNLWKGFKNYLYMTGQPDALPYLSPRLLKKMFTTGSLGDYMGLPSTVVSPNGGNGVMYRSSRSFDVYSTNSSSASLLRTITNPISGDNLLMFSGFFSDPDKFYLPKGLSSAYGASEIKSFSEFPEGYRDYIKLPFYNHLPKRISYFGSVANYEVIPSTGNLRLNLYLSSNSNVPIIHIEENEEYSVPYISRRYMDSIRPGSYVFIAFHNINGTPLEENFVWDGDNLVEGTEFNPTWKTVTYGVEDFGSKYPHIAESYPHKISALPFRAYEQIYNAFYRDDRNNPYLTPDGIYDPNVFLPTTDGGVDDSDYDLRYRNWEQDFLTTAQKSPQFGNAPLVGITNSGVATFAAADGSKVSSQLSVGEDGETIATFSTTNNSSVNRSLVELASSGISINDLRGVNSLQRFLETNIRRGLRYKDQVFAHTGVEVGYDELDMPEFIGSVVQTVDTSQVNQTSSSDSDPLGSYAGQLSCVGGGNTLQKYCDENGYIMAILSICPVPCYGQLLPKHFLKTDDPLDFYDSAFAYLGNQPVTYNEVCPLQAAVIGQKPSATFGYQKAWYDYMSMQDSVHGQFRTTMRPYVLTRMFSQLPTLNSDFLTVRPEQLNDVFSISEINGEPIDTILGQIYFDCTAERRIPKYAIPRLE